MTRTVPPVAACGAAPEPPRTSWTPDTRARLRPAPKRRTSRLAPGGRRLATASRACRSHGHRHQRMPGWVKLHLVDAVPVAVMRVQHRRVAVREAPPLRCPLAAGQLPERHERLDVRLAEIGQAQ